MKVIATGKYNGETVEVTWSERDFLDGPGDVVLAIIDESASMTGTVMGDPLTGTIESGYLEHYFGFIRVASRVIREVSFEFPDGEPEELPAVPEGHVA